MIGHRERTDDTIHDVIFDFCGVLLDWSIASALRGEVSQPLIDEISAEDDPFGFLQYEDRMDAGENFADIIDDYRREYGQEMADIFTHYIEHYAQAIPRMVPGMQALLTDLRANGYGAWGLTNWSHETFHVAFEQFPQLATLLEGTVVSGVEKRYKPNRDVFELTLNRFGLAPAQCVFLDDSHANVLAAVQVGIHGIDFTDAESARRSLADLGVALPQSEATASAAGV